MKKLEDILNSKLPCKVNQSVKKENGLRNTKLHRLNKSDFLKCFLGDNFVLLDYPEIDIKGVDSYCLIGENGIPTLSIEKAYKETPNLKVPYLELNVSKSCGVPVCIFLTIDNDKVLAYTSRKGNTIRLDTNRTFSNSGFFEFDWENKEILEKSDLLYVVKNINYQALIDYPLHVIYEAFQKYKDVGCEGLVIFDRVLCVEEFEEDIELL